MNKVKVEQSWTKLKQRRTKLSISLKHWHRAMSENVVKFDKQIAKNIKILLSVCECVSEISSYWAAYAAKDLSKDWYNAIAWSTWVKITTWSTAT